MRGTGPLDVWAAVGATRPRGGVCSVTRRGATVGGGSPSAGIRVVGAHREVGTGGAGVARGCPSGVSGMPCHPAARSGGGVVGGFALGQGLCRGFGAR